MEKELCISDWMPKAVSMQPGDTIEAYDQQIGRRLSWSEVIGPKMGTLILYKRVLQSYTYFEVVRPVRSLIKQIKWYSRGKDGKYEERLSDRVICEHGSRQNLLINEWTRPEFFEIANRHCDSHFNH